MMVLTDTPMRAGLRVLLVAIATSCLSPGQVSVADVEKLLAAKISEEVIATKVRATGKATDLTTDQMISLKKAGASDDLIRVLMEGGKGSGMSTGAAPATTTTRRESTAGAEENGEKREVGVYAKRGTEWVELQPEVVQFKTGGSIKNLASAGIVKKDLNGLVPGQHSRNSLKSPLEFLIVAPEGISVTEYQLLRLRENKENREFRSVTGGILNAQSGAMRDMVPFEGKKVAPRQFLVVLPGTMGAGEYGFLPPGGANGGGVVGMPTGATGKLYSFRFLE